MRTQPAGPIVSRSPCKGLLFSVLGSIATICSAAILAAFATWPLSGQEYSVHGRLEVLVKSGAKDPGETNLFGFYVEVLGVRYKIRIWPSAEEAAYHEYSFIDGTMFTLHHLQRSQSLNSNGSIEKTSRNSSLYPAIVEYRELPPNDGSRAQFVWFAYASGRFFQNVSNSLMLPIWEPEDPTIRRQPFEIQTFCELSPLSPRLPSVVTFRNDGFYKSYNPVTKSLDVIPLAPPFDAGFTKALYRVTAFTNTPRNEIPVSFVFTVYATPIGPGQQLFERIVVYGLVTAASDGAPERASTPGFDGAASVGDFRVHGSVRAYGTDIVYQLGRYSITNGRWMGTDQVDRLRRDAESKLTMQLSMKSSSRILAARRWPIMCCLFLATVPAVWALGRSIRLNRK